MEYEAEVATGTIRVRRVGADTAAAVHRACRDLCERSGAKAIALELPLSQSGTAEVCRAAGAWLHVDAAMSGMAALEPELRWVNDGLQLADSYCTNAHKWMGVNVDCSLYWTADRVALLGALSILPEYLRSAAAETRHDR